MQKGTYNVEHHATSEPRMPQKKPSGPTPKLSGRFPSTGGGMPATKAPPKKKAY